MGVTGLIVAGGSGRRFGGEVPKQLLPLQDRPLLLWSLQAFQRCAAVDEVVLVLLTELIDRVAPLLREHALDKVTGLCPGGATRRASVRAGLEHLSPGTAVVAIHDAARPLVSPALIAAVVVAAAADGAALAALPLRDTLKRGEGERVTGTVDRRGLYLAQTPQAFQLELLRRALAVDATAEVTDDVQLVERLGLPVRLVPGEPANLKVTVPEDLELARDLLRARGNPSGGWPRTGIGYDVHRLVPGRALVLGGVTIPFPLGLLGHSDADVLCHAIGDALLGAASLGDLGAHFPDSDPAYQGARSLELLGHIRGLVAAAGYRPGNVDATVVCERPRLASHLPAMRENLSRALVLPAERISVKATTTEGLGCTGRGEGIAAQAAVLLLPWA